MILIIGGAYQGKLTWAVNEYGLCESSLYDLSGGMPESAHSCFYHLEALTKAAYKSGIGANELYSELSPFIGGSVVISREIGSGIVPMDADDRAWREMHGVLLKMLAHDADSVIRIFCGLPEVLK